MHSILVPVCKLNICKIKQSIFVYRCLDDLKKKMLKKCHLMQVALELYFCRTGREGKKVFFKKSGPKYRVKLMVALMV